MSHHALTIRAATSRDHGALARLRPRDTGRHLGGTALLAEADGNVIAAIGLTSGTVLADPANPNRAAIHSLRARRYRLLRQGADVGPSWTLIRRLAHFPNHTPMTEEVSK
jgi:hypothetical protein